MCEKCNRLIAAIRYEADYISSTYMNEQTPYKQAQYEIARSLIGILENLEEGRGL